MLKKYFITGLLIWIPLAITAWVLSMIVGTMDQSLLLLPHAIRPETLIGMYIPGIGVILTLLVVLVTGLVTANILGQRLVQFWEGVLWRIPVVKSIYYGVKQISDTLFSGSGDAFRKVLLVQYPHQGAWSVAFQTSSPAPCIADRLEDEYIGIFIPTTPSPVNGFFFFVKKSEAFEIDMSIDDALKYIISMGVMVPATKPSHAARLPIDNPIGRVHHE